VHCHFEEFKRAMKYLGYEIKEGKHIAFRAKGQERFTRAKTLGDLYAEENIVKRISDKTIINSKQKRNMFAGNVRRIKRVPIGLGQQVVISARRQQIINVKDIACMLLLLRQEGINKSSDFDLRINELNTQLSDIKQSIKELDNKISDYREVAKCLATVKKQRDIYSKYESSNPFSKKGFFNKHEGDILSYKHAVRKLTELKKILKLL
jgi:hypothetical protein